MHFLLISVFAPLAPHLSVVLLMAVARWWPVIHGVAASVRRCSLLALVSGIFGTCARRIALHRQRRVADFVICHAPQSHQCGAYVALWA